MTWLRNASKVLVPVTLLLSVATVLAQTAQSDSGVAVSVSVTARDRSGTVVRDVKLEDLTVLDNARGAKILGVENAENLPVRVGIVLAGDKSTFKLQQKAANQLLESLRPGDQAFVLTQATARNSRSWPSQKLVWESDLKALSAFVDGLDWKEALENTTGPVMAMLALNPDKPFRRLMVEIRVPGQESYVGDQTTGSLRLGRLEEERQHAIGVRPAFASEVDQRQLQEIADYQRRNVVVYAFSLGYQQQGSANIERLAVSTGGRYLAWGKIESEVAGIRDDLDNQMLITFELQPGDSQKPHTLEIHVNRKDVRLAYPDHFYPLTPN